MTNHDVTLYMDVFSLCFHVFFVQPFSSILYPFVSVTSVFIRLSIYSLILYIGCTSFSECIFETLYLWKENESFDFSLIIVIIFHFQWFFFYYYVEFYYDFRGLEFFFLYCIGKVSLCIINFTVHSMFGKFEKS